MNSMKVLVHPSFEFGGFCTWPRVAVQQGIARCLGREFCEKLKFVVFEMPGLEDLQMSPNEYHESLGA